MAWNEPGNNGKGNDPWGSGPKGQGPPDLDEALRRLQQKLKGLFVGGGSRNTNSTLTVSWGSIGLILFILLAIYVLSGIYIVKPAERAAVFRFGKYSETVLPGPHWIARFIQSKTIINVDRVNSFRHEAEMLTRDENIVSVTMSVQYRIADVENYLFRIINPINALQQATESAIRQVIGRSTLDEILTFGRESIRQDIKTELIGMLDYYQSGLFVLDVPMQPAQPPEPVRAAFDDAIKAREDAQRSVNDANAYINRVVPIAEGQASRIEAEAMAYKQRVISQSEGETSRFTQLLPEYQQAPEVTRQRLYLDAVGEVLAHTSKIFIDEGESGQSNVLYLPIDKLMRGSTDTDGVPENYAQQNTRLSQNMSSSRNASDRFRDTRDRESTR